MRIERDALNFRMVLSEHCQLTARIDGIDRDFLFGNARGTRIAKAARTIYRRYGVTQRPQRVPTTAR